MWNLIKGVFRSFSKNKIAIIGLVFLVFLFTTIFTALTNTTNAMTHQYTTISQSGNLHDFTISEYYVTGKLNYKFTGQVESGKNDEEYYIPQQTKNDDGTFTRIYNYTIDESATTGLYYSFYEQHRNDSEYDYLFNIKITIISEYECPYIPYNGQSLNVYTPIQIIDQQEIYSYIQIITNEYYSIINNSPTPMEEFLKNEMQNEVEFRKFNSLDINNSSDNLFYKLIEYDSSYTIDEMVLLDDSNGNKGWNVFDDSECKKSTIKGISDLELLEYKPKLNDDGKIIDYSDPILKAKFELINIGSFGEENSTSNLFNILATEKIGSETYNKKVDEYVSKYLPCEFIYERGYRTTIQWQTTAPSSWYIDNWTSSLAIVNPQHMEENNKLTVVDYIVNDDYIFDVNGSNYTFEEYKNDNNYQDDRVAFINLMNSINQETYENWFTSIPNNYKISIDATEYLIIGCGITPDFIYPIVSLEKPIPNPKKEAIVWTNNNGYKRIEDSFRSNPTEKYIVGKFKNGVNQQEVLDKINNEASKIMAWPLGTNAAYLATDTNNVLNASSFRIAYIPDLISQINFLAYFITSFVVVLGLFICAVVIRRYISLNRVNIGIMEANGISKWKISFSMMMFAIFPTFVGGAIGYIIGVFLQAPILSLFANYWTLQTPLIAFNFWSLLGTIIIPLFVFCVISLITCFITLREKPTNLMKSGSEYKTNSISKGAKAEFSSFGIMTRFRISIAFSSLWKLLILCIMSAMTVCSLTFSFATIGKYGESKDLTFASRKYEFAIDLYTPTKEGGQYFVIDSDKQSISKTHEGYINTFFNDNTNSNAPNLCRTYYNTNENTYGVLKNNGNLFIPFAADSDGQKYDLLYLKNRTSSKLSLDYVMGALGMTSNPWTIAVSLMPENTSKQCNSAYQNTVNSLGEEYGDDFPTYFKKDGNNWTITDKVLATLGTGLQPDFIEILTEIYTNKNPLYVNATNEQEREEHNYLNKDYIINYGLVALGEYDGKKDETYTYILGNVSDLNNGIKPDLNKEVKIMGIKPNTQYMDLEYLNGNKIDLYSVFNEEKNKNPIIINAYAAQKYSLSVGDKISFKINNHTERNFPNPNDDYITEFTVAAITSTYQGEEYFISQDLANQILGLGNNKNDVKPNNNNIYYEQYWDIFNKKSNYSLTEEQANNLVININDQPKEYFDTSSSQYGFNGIFTNDPNGGYSILHSLNLYSPSGLYPATDSISSDINSTFAQLLKQGVNLEIANIITGIINTDIGEKINQNYLNIAEGGITKEEAENFANDESIKEFLDLYISLYGTSSQVNLISNADSRASTEAIFNNMAIMADGIEAAVMIVIIPMVIIIVLLISSLLINDSKRLAAMLKALGYSDRENVLSFLSIYVPVILIGLLLAIPITFVLISLYQISVFYGVGILIMANAEWWQFIVSLFLVILILVISGISMYYSLKKDRLVDMIK